MSQNSLWGHPELRKISIQRIEKAKQKSTRASSVSAMELEEQVFKRSHNEEEYFNTLTRLERNLAKEFPSKPLSDANNEDFNGERKVNEEKLDFKIPSFSAPTTNTWRQPSPSLINPFAVNSAMFTPDQYRSQLIRCQQKLNNKLSEETIQNEEHLETYRKLLMELSSSQSSNLPTRVLDEIEALLDSNLEPINAKTEQSFGGHTTETQMATVVNTDPSFLKTAIETTPTSKTAPNSTPLSFVKNQDANRIQNQSPLENVISQVIEWTLASSKVNTDSPPTQANQLIKPHPKQTPEMNLQSPQYSNAHGLPAQDNQRSLEIQSVTSLNHLYQHQTAVSTSASTPVAQTQNVATSSHEHVNNPPIYCMSSVNNMNRTNQCFPVRPAQTVQPETSFYSFNPMNNQFVKQSTASNFSNVPATPTQNLTSPHGVSSNQLNFNFNGNNMNQRPNVQSILAATNKHNASDKNFIHHQRFTNPSSINNGPVAQAPNVMASSYGLVRHQHNFNFNLNRNQLQRSTSGPGPDIVQQGFIPGGSNRPAETNAPSGVEAATNSYANTTWRENAQEALLKSIMQIEGKVYSLAETKENYMNFFQDVFNFANEALKKKGSIDVSSSPQLQATTESSMQKLKKLLPNEPANVVESVTRDWNEVESRVGNLMKGLSANDVDQPSSSIKLQPDEFENKIDCVLKAVSPSCVPQTDV